MEVIRENQNRILKMSGYEKKIKKVPDDKQKAYCTVCMTAISIAGLGISASDIHKKEKKHLLKSPAKSQSRIQLASSQKERKKESASVSKPVNQSSTTSFIAKEETVKTERFVGRLSLE